ncbi:hypothetical protein BV898_14584 [Hypsibius exemplaris]|uniref:Transcriptional regulatory protein n=1 Tax=Hypsibius exemplaris TaxID=2072580 RepID=A0A9X6NAV7_HYPEX|nr:hypothetical protein BV898_14584 [Hypsibius exemplaris]
MSLPFDAALSNFCTAPRNFNNQISRQSTGAFSADGRRRFVSDTVQRDLSRRKILSRLFSGRNLPARCFSTTAHSLAGHSHWKNVKGTKEAKDAQKSNNANRVVRDMRVCIRATGSANPKDNPELARIIQNARLENVSGETIDRVLTGSAAGKDKPLTEWQLQCKGPQGSLFIVQFASVHQKRTEQEIRIIFKKHVASIESGNGILNNFDLKSMVTAKYGSDGSSALDLEKAEEVAIEAGAEEVVAGEYPGEVVFICDAKEASKVAKAAENADYKVIETVTEYVPKTTVELSDEARAELNALKAKLEANADFLNIHLNCET